MAEDVAVQCLAGGPGNGDGVDLRMQGTGADSDLGKGETETGQRLADRRDHGLDFGAGEREPHQSVLQGAQGRLSALHISHRHSVVGV